MDRPTGDLPELLSNMSYKVIVNVNVSSLLYVNNSVKQETDDSSPNSSFTHSSALPNTLSLYKHYLLSLTSLCLKSSITLFNATLSKQKWNVCITTLLNVSGWHVLANIKSE